MDIEQDLPKPAGKTRTTLITAALLLALVASACSSNADVQAVDAEDSTPDTFVSAEEDVVEEEENIVDEQVGEPSEELAFAEDEDDDDADNETPPETSTPVTITTEAPDDEPVFSDFPDATPVRVVNTGSETLNVRAEPNPSAEILGEFAANTWYVEVTGRVADIGDVRWHEVRLATGLIGWSHGGFLEPTNPGCVNIDVPNVLDTQPWEANLDNDGLGDVVHYIRDTDGIAYVRVNYGNGAVTATQVADFGDAHPDDLQAVAIAEDINGDGFDEIKFSTFQELQTEHEFITMNGCDFTIHEKVFFQLTFGEEGQGWACKDFGTPNAEFYDLQLAGDGTIVRAFGNTFDPATGFTGTDELLGMTHEEMLAYFDPECTTDFE